jgi:hypothetical protein
MLVQVRLLAGLEAELPYADSLVLEQQSTPYVT